MSQKRQQQEDATKPLRSCDDGGGASNSDDKRRKLPTFRSVVQEVMNICRVQNFMEPVLEPLIRKVVKEEVDLALRKYMNSMKRSYGKDIQTSETRSLQLQFQSTISLPVFTGSRIEGEDCNSLKVALVDSLTGQVVSSGVGCSAKVEIVVLEGDFDGDEGDNWTVEEFKNNIVKEREGKKALLTGDVFLTLNDGIGVVGDISFTDNSSWTRSRKFRLGARVVDNCHGIRVKEAKTESFIVRDHRGELYKKHHPPSLSDEVWRLEKIGKDGAFHKRLSKERVYTVKDFLILLFLDPGRLRNVLGTGMSAKMWEVTVDHARTCVLDKKVFLYYPSAPQPKIGVVFNVVGQVMGLLSEDRYIASDKMSETEKDEARNSVITAFRHWEEVISFDDEASLSDSVSRLSTAQYSSNMPIGVGDSDACKGLTPQTIGRSDNPQLSASSPDMVPSIYSVGCLDDYSLHGIDSMDVRFDQTLNFPCQVANTFSSDADFFHHSLYEDGHLHDFDPFSLPSTSLESPADLQSTVNTCFVAHTTAVPAYRRWKILFSVFRWVLQKRRNRVKEIPGY